MPYEDFTDKDVPKPLTLMFPCQDCNAQGHHPGAYDPESKCYDAEMCVVCNGLGWRMTPMGNTIRRFIQWCIRRDLIDLNPLTDDDEEQP